MIIPEKNKKQKSPKFEYIFSLFFQSYPPLHTFSFTLRKNDFNLPIYTYSQFTLMPHVNRLPGQRADAQLSSCYSFLSSVLLSFPFSCWSPPFHSLWKLAALILCQTNSSGNLKILLGSPCYHVLPMQRYPSVLVVKRGTILMSWVTCMKGPVYPHCIGADINITFFHSQKCLGLRKKTIWSPHILSSLRSAPEQCLGYGIEK